MLNTMAYALNNCQLMFADMLIYQKAGISREPYTTRQLHLQHLKGSPHQVSANDRMAEKLQK